MGAPQRPKMTVRGVLCLSRGPSPTGTSKRSTSAGVRIGELCEIPSGNGRLDSR